MNKAELDPLFKRIGDQIQASIISNNLTNNQKLPSESQFVEEFSVSRTTIQRALEYLENKGIIYREQGKGSFVQIKSARIDMFNFGGFSDYAESLNKAVITKVLEQTIINRSGEDFLVLLRLRGIVEEEGVKWLTLDKSTISLSTFPKFDRYDFSQTSIYQMMREDYHLPPRYSHLKAGAIIAESHHEEFFLLKEPTPLLKVDGVVRDINGTQVEEVEIIYSPEANFNFLIGV